MLTDLQKKGIKIYIILPKFTDTLKQGKSYIMAEITDLQQEYNENIRILAQAGVEVRIRTNYRATIKDEIIFVDNKIVYFCNSFSGRKYFYRSDDYDLIEMFMAKDDYLREIYGN